MKKALPWAIKLAFIAGATALAAFSIPVAIVALGATILTALHDKAGGLVELSFGPLKAKLERDISEAEKLVAKLRQLTMIQAKAAISTGVRSGRWSDESGWLYDQVRALELAMRDIGLNDDQLREARADFVLYTISDAGNAAMGRGRIPMHLGQGVESEWRSALEGGLDKDANKIEAFLRKWGQLTPERSNLLDDMRWMKQHGDIRDKAQYLRAIGEVPWPKS